MGKRKREPQVQLVTDFGESCNVMLSIQYHGDRRADFGGLSFSTTKGVERAIRVLNIDDDLLALGLPRLKGPDCVFRSSFGYPDTIEILYPDCNEPGKPSEIVFHTCYQRFSQDPRVLEHMQINSLFMYFLPRAVTKLDRTYSSPYILKRPNRGWKFWNPVIDPEQHLFFQRRKVVLESREQRRRDQSVASSRPRSRQGSPYARTTDGEDPTSQPLAHSLSSSILHADLIKPVTVLASRRSKTRSPSPAFTPLTTPATSIITTDATSISSAIQSLANLVKPVDAASLRVSDVPITPIRDTPQPDKSDPIDQPKDDVEHLRTQLEQSTTQRNLQRKRIRELQQELAIEREARSQVEARLEEERRLLEAERRNLNNMQQECKAPSLVPPLLDALLNITAMSYNMQNS